MNTQPAQSTCNACNAAAGDPRFEVYVGDFPSCQPIIGYPWTPGFPCYPDELPFPQFPCPPTKEIVYVTAGIDTGVNWRVEQLNDRLVAAVDLPGVRVDAVRVRIENSTILVIATRFDTGVTSSLQHFISTDHDPSTASAELTAGVLTVTVMRLQPKSSHQVPVTAK
jgi:Hsp20/alpha crystallin family protein